MNKSQLNKSQDADERTENSILTSGKETQRRTRAVLTVIFCSILIGSVLGSCSSRDRGFVQREWSLSLRELGIVPVFPPREDVVVGDVYAYDYDPDGIESRKLFETEWECLSEDEQQKRLQLGMNSRLARLDLNDKIAKEYEETIAAPATPADYNAILGNPALAAANEAVNTAKAKVAAIETSIKAKKTAVEAAAATLAQKTIEFEDAQTAVANAKADLAKAQAKPVDTTAETARVATAEAAVIVAEDELTTAKRALEDKPGDAQLKKDVVTKTRKKEDADLELTRAKAALAAKKGAANDVSNELLAVSQAEAAERVKATELKTAQRAKEAADTAYSKIQEDKAKELAAAKEKVESTKKVRDAIAKAGVKELYAQPRDSEHNIFDLTPLQAPNAKRDDIRNARENRLRLVGFPEFSTVSFNQGDLSALIPVEALSLGLNISFDTVERVSVSVPAAESYGLSVEKIRDSLVDSRSPKKIKDELRVAASFQTLADATGGCEYIYFRVITEVFYARALDVSLFSSESFGARLAASTPGGTDGNEQETATPNAPPINTNSVGSEDGKASLSSLESRLGTTQSAPGGTVQFVGYSERSVGLRRVFDRPIAIGFRSLRLKVRSCDGVIVDVRSSSSTVPSFSPEEE